MDKKKAQVVVYYLDEHNKKYFLLLQMNKERNEYWQNITGSLENNESFEEGGQREAFEETGIDLKKIEKFTGPHLSFNFKDRWGFDVLEKVFFLELNSKVEIILDPHEHQAFKWVNEDEISETSVHYRSNFEALKEAKKG